MTTIQEKTADTATLIDDIANTAISDSSGEWSDADADLTTSNSGGWQSRARVIHHSTTGLYLTFWAQKQNSGIDVGESAGVGVCVSTDFDTTNNHPAGYTTAMPDAPFSNDINNRVSESFSDTNLGGNSGMNGGVYYRSDYNLSFANLMSHQVTYFISVGANHLSVAAWNTSDGTHGGAGVLSWEHVDGKFWNDGNVPYAMHTADSLGNYGGSMNCYSFSHYANRTGGNTSVYNAGSGFSSGEWGIINPDSNDDTFFFRRPVVYQTLNGSVPVAYCEDSITNDRNEGASHGDMVSYNGTDYRMVRQSGAGNSATVTCGLRYE